MERALEDSLTSRIRLYGGVVSFRFQFNFFKIIFGGSLGFLNASCTEQSTTCVRRNLHKITLSNSTTDIGSPSRSTLIPRCAGLLFREVFLGVVEYQ
jgi:hypothetical protein